MKRRMGCEVENVEFRSRSGQRLHCGRVELMRSLVLHLNNNSPLVCVKMAF